MSTLFQSNSHVAAVAESRSNEKAETELSSSEIHNLQSQVTVLTNTIADEALRIAVGKILADLVFLLDYLSLIRGGTRERNGIREVLSLLDAIRGEASALVAFIENHALHLEKLGDRLYEILDSTAYAIKHEVRRVFEGELAHLPLAQGDQEIDGALRFTQGVLTNCFQQCMINLARVFDNSITEARLFQDWQVRRERSLVLCRDLSLLIHLIKASENEWVECLPDQLKAFREGSMRSLMYKDWREYESLSDQVIAAMTNGKDASDVLHQLRCYLETLFGHVKARAVLADLSMEAFSVQEEVSLS